MHQLSQFQSAKCRKPKLHHVPRVACSVNQNNQTPNTSEGEFPHRRNLLLGLGVLCGAAVTLNNNNNSPFAFAAPSASSPMLMFPLVLDSAVSTVVKRPKKSRTKTEKEEEEEVLVIEGIEYEGNTRVRFDVIINYQDYKLIQPDNTEFAGSFVNEPRSSNKKVITSMSLGITDLLEQLGADDDDSIVVTLVPRLGHVKIRGIKIELLGD